jgi:hypothetical protein
MVLFKLLVVASFSPPDCLSCLARTLTYVALYSLEKSLISLKNSFTYIIKSSSAGLMLILDMCRTPNMHGASKDEMQITPFYTFRD